MEIDWEGLGLFLAACGLTMMTVRAFRALRRINREADEAVDFTIESPDRSTLFCVPCQVQVSGTDLSAHLRLFHRARVRAPDDLL